jgi:hypothetical protein
MICACCADLVQNYVKLSSCRFPLYLFDALADEVDHDREPTSFDPSGAQECLRRRPAGRVRSTAPAATDRSALLQHARRPAGRRRPPLSAGISYVQVSSPPSHIAAAFGESHRDRRHHFLSPNDPEAAVGGPNFLRCEMSLIQPLRPQKSKRKGPPICNNCSAFRSLRCALHSAGTTPRPNALERRSRLTRMASAIRIPAGTDTQLGIRNVQPSVYRRIGSSTSSITR